MLQTHARKIYIGAIRPIATYRLPIFWKSTHSPIDSAEQVPTYDHRRIPNDKHCGNGDRSLNPTDRHMDGLQTRNGRPTHIKLTQGPPNRMPSLPRPKSPAPACFPTTTPPIRYIQKIQNEPESQIHDLHNTSQQKNTRGNGSDHAKRRTPMETFRGRPRRQGETNHP